jgi:hypothetical protein
MENMKSEISGGGRGGDGLRQKVGTWKNRSDMKTGCKGNITDEWKICMTSFRKGWRKQKKYKLKILRGVIANMPIIGFRDKLNHRVLLLKFWI